MSKPTLKTMFSSHQKLMMESLSVDRSIIHHPTSKGDASELNWIEWLNTYLPKRYAVDKAFVIDSNDNLSQQIDLVIYDKLYSPFVFNHKGAIYIPAESVYGVFEVKQELNKKHVEYAANKIQSVRSLTRTSAKIIHAGGTIDKPKPPFQILGGILTTESSWNPPFGESFSESILGLNAVSRIDIGCSLKDGAFLIEYDSRKTNINLCPVKNALIFFFLKLLTRLQELGTVPAMDIGAYQKAIL